MSSKAVPGGMPPSGSPVGRVVDEPAGLADPLLRNGRLAHGPKGTFQAVKFDRPPPGEELNDSGEETVPRQAATVILLRGGADALELLLVRRTPHARFMGGVWVFPGGAVDAHEGEGDAAHRVAAVRELQEEAGIVVADPAGLVKFSRWITPAEVVVRFDTHFFLAPLPDGPGGDDRRRRDRRLRLVHARRRARRPRARRHRARLPHHQAPRAARRLPERRRAAAASPAVARSVPCSRASSPRARRRVCCCPASRATTTDAGHALTTW